MTSLSCLLVFFEIFALRFSAALGNMSKLYCSRLHENFLVYLFTKNRLFFMAHELFLFAHEFHEFTRITKRLDNGDLIGRTNFH